MRPTPGSGGGASEAHVGRTGDQVGTDGEDGSDRNGTDESFADPDQGVDSGHRRQDRWRAMRRPGPRWRIRRQRRTTPPAPPRNPATIVAAMAPPVVLGRTRISEPEDDPTDQRGHEAMLRTFNPSDDDATVGEQERLHDHHHGHDQGAHPRPEEDRGQSPAEQVAAGSGRHREIEHLDREDEGGGQAGHRDLPLRQPLAGLLERSPDSAGRDGRARHRGGQVHIAIGHVHRPQPPVNASDLQYTRPRLAAVSRSGAILALGNDGEMNRAHLESMGPQHGREVSSSLNARSTVRPHFSQTT